MAEDRDGLKEHLWKAGIETGIYYPVPINRQPAYKGFGFGGFPVAEEVAGSIISLPMHPYMKKEDISQVADSVFRYSILRQETAPMTAACID